MKTKLSNVNSLLLLLSVLFLSVILAWPLEFLARSSYASQKCLSKCLHHLNHLPPLGYLSKFFGSVCAPRGCSGQWSQIVGAGGPHHAPMWEYTKWSAPCRCVPHFLASISRFRLLSQDRKLYFCRLRVKVARSRRQI